ncbi:hypothetical protein F4808DRAFT_464792 [Astrocystis sublimbata]|nr:hypothetical protein F4808DRAFT_464792 [Astrocystis sublimbata]
MVQSKKRPVEADDASASGPAAKKHRKGFRVGPANLPDGAWKRKVDRIKSDLIHKAKVKQAYKKIKTDSTTSKPAPTSPDLDAANVTIVNTDARGDSSSDRDEEAQDGEGGDDDDTQAEADQPSPQLHPQRQAMLDGDDSRNPPRTRNSRASDDGEDKDDDNNSPSENQNQGREQRHHQQRRKFGYFDKALSTGEQKKAAAAERQAERERREAEHQRKIAERERFRRGMAKARKPGRDGQRRLGRESGLLLEKIKKTTG